MCITRDSLPAGRNAIKLGGVKDRRGSGGETCCWYVWGLWDGAVSLPPPEGRMYPPWAFFWRIEAIAGRVWVCGTRFL